MPQGFTSYQGQTPMAKRKTKRGPKKLRPELREFLDRVIVPALVEKWFAQKKEHKK